MIKNGLMRRVLLALGFMIFGLNLIYFGCIESGANHRYNPIWRFLEGFVSFEKTVLFIVLIGFGIYLILLFVLFVLDKKIDFENSLRIDQERGLQRSLKAETATPKPAVIPIPVQEKPKPKPKLTSDELKEKAIREILKGW